MVKTSISSKPPLVRQVLLQLFAATLLSLAFGWYRDWAWSTVSATMLGGLIALGTGLYFNWRSFRCDLDVEDEMNPHRILADVYRAAVAKTMMAGVLLALAFKYGDQLDKPFILIGFVLISLIAVVCNVIYSRDTSSTL